MATQREVSRQDWNANNHIEDINSGSLQRIADACELMAKNYVQLQDDKDNYQRWYKERGVRIGKLERSNSSLRGQITKLKKAAKGVA